MRYKDYMIRGQDKAGQVRFFAITTKSLVEKKRKAQNYSPIATAAIGRLMSAALMMGSMLKNEDERISIQIKGEGPMGGLVASRSKAMSKTQPSSFLQTNMGILPSATPSPQGR